MRAAFDTTMSVYASIGGVPDPIPWAVGVPCRFVPQYHVIPQEPPAGLQDGWVTYSAVELAGPLSQIGGTTITLDYSMVSWLELASIPGQPWVVLMTESLTGVLPHAYGRARVCPPFWFFGLMETVPWLAPKGWDDSLVSSDWRGFIGAPMP